MTHLLPQRPSRRARRVGTAAVVLAVLAAPAHASAAAGAPDPSFGVGGAFTMPVGPGDAAVTAVTVQPDGRIVIAGWAEASAGTPADRDFLVGRLNADGTPDPTFNPFGAQPGVRRTPVGPGSADDVARAIALGPAGTIYVAGETDPPPAGGGDFSDTAIVRYTSGGVEDDSFSGDGLHTFSNGNFDRANGVVVQGGKPVLTGAGGATDSGMDVVRLDPGTGALDTTFNAAGPTPGLHDVDFGDGTGDVGNALVLQPDGKLVVGGDVDQFNQSDVGLARLNADGTLDTGTFGGATGRLRLPLAGRQTLAALDLQGTAVAFAGESLDFSGGERGFLVGRATGAGEPDAAFSDDGLEVTQFPAADGTRAAGATGLIVTGDRLVATGSAFACAAAGCADFAAARYLGDGSLDPSFGDGGRRLWSIAGGNDLALASARGSLLLFGSAFDGVREVLAGMKASETDDGGRGDGEPDDDGDDGGDDGDDGGQPTPDLAVTVDAPADAEDRLSYDGTVTIRNLSTTTATLPSLLVSIAGQAPRIAPADVPQALVDFVGPLRVPASVTSTTAGLACPAMNAAAFACSLEALPPGGAAFATVNVAVRYRLTALSASVTCVSREPCDNNAGRATTVADGPHARIARFDDEEIEILKGIAKSLGSSGQRAWTAQAGRSRSRVTKVQIALVRARGGARAAAPACRWLRGRRGRFRPRRPDASGTCSRPLWLTARGTSRWRYRLRRPLPGGRYVLYARAVDAAGRTENVFSARRGNRLRFTAR